MALQPPGAGDPARHNLDPHLTRYAARTEGMTASEIRALFAVASRPEVVSLAGGMPNLAALPLESLSHQMAEIVAQDGLTALQYGSAQGIPTLREQICEVMAMEGITAHPDDVVVTVGSQMGLDMVTRLFCDPGDVVIAENGGVNGYVVTTKVRELGVGQGYNAATEEYGDLVAQGVLDPVKVTRSALVNATSIAGMLLTTETLVVDKPEEEEAPAAGHGHGHGH